MSGSPIDYSRFLQEAHLGLVRRVLERISEDGLVGEHHCYLTFRTDDSDVVLPDFLRDSYPEAMTIVLQHQFWDLFVDDTAFSVTLTFSGRRERLSVPWRALLAFSDPHARFELPLHLGVESPRSSESDPEDDPSPAPLEVLRTFDPAPVHELTVVPDAEGDSLEAEAQDESEQLASRSGEESAAPQSSVLEPDEQDDEGAESSAPAPLEAAASDSSQESPTDGEDDSDTETSDTETSDTDTADRKTEKELGSVLKFEDFRKRK